jgi:phospholipase D1/2
MQPDGRPILRTGETCWKIGRAGRFTVIIDAAGYFAAVRAAVLKASHSAMFIGWEFDTRITLDPREGAGEGDAPNRLGAFLDWVVERRPDLRIHVLQWDLGMIETLGRGSTPIAILDWMTSARIRFKLDSAHPPGAAHHQKIVVIDDALAFCGGIDMTADRWDTREHLDDDPHRRRPTTRRRYGPWHDVTTAVDGAAARALGELARERWQRATGEAIPACPPAGDLWPEGLAPLLTDVDVAISRTAPEYEDRGAVREIEALYLEAIARARRVLYIESQYFAARRIAEAMAERLRRPDAPEIVVVNPETAGGWLEEAVMGASRARLLALVRSADRHDSFRIYTPVAAGGTPIYVHAKVLVMDDRLLRVGSSNLNNRSLGYDTECDLSVEAVQGAENEETLRGRIESLRNDLLAEHLGVARAAVEAALRRSEGRLIPAIESLRGAGRSLVPFDQPDLTGVGEAVFAENELLDPERPARRWGTLSIRRLLPGGGG